MHCCGLQMLARGRRPEGQPVHDALTLDGQTTRERLQAQRELQEEQELLVISCRYPPVGMEDYESLLASCNYYALHLSMFCREESHI